MQRKALTKATVVGDTTSNEACESASTDLALSPFKSPGVTVALGAWRVELKGKSRTI